MSVLSQAHRRKLRRLTLELAINSNRLPSALTLTGVRFRDATFHGVGAFSDVFIGNMGQLIVAIKRLRVYTASTEDEKAWLKRVREPLGARCSHHLTR